MNNLTTRKIILGLLMGLVLVFSVQGVAEAIENPDITDVTLNTNIVYNVGDSSVTISINALDFDDSDRKETLRITKSSGVALTSFGGLTSVTLTEDHSTPSTDLTDGTDNGDRFSYTRDGRTFATANTAVSIPITFTAKGKQTVTISSRDYDAGADPNNPEFSGAWSYTYTYYVKGAGSKTTTVSLLGLRNGYKTGIFEGTEIKVHNGDSSHYDVTYTTGGTLQIEQPNGDLVSYIVANRASSVFDAWLTMSATHQVTAKVTGSDPGVETVGVYIIGTPTLAVGSPGDANRDGVVETPTAPGNKEMGGRINQVLSNAFSARVTDGAATPGNVPGIVVTFRVRGSGDAGGYLVFDSDNLGTLVTSNNRAMFDANDRQITEATEKVLYVRTDADGLANVDFQLGTDRKQDVTVSAVGGSKTVSAYAGESVSGNQLVEPSSVVSRAPNRAGEYELRVKAEDEDGNALSQHHVEFRTSDGDLENSAIENSKTSSGRIAVRTGPRGVAFVFFDPKDDSGSPRVTAHLLDTAISETEPAISDTVIDVVVFDIGGTVTRPRDEPVADDDDEPQVARLTINVSGTGATRSVTVNALNAAGTTLQIGIPITLSGTAVTVPRSITSGTAVTIPVPSTPDTYTLLATDPSGTFAFGTANVVVTAPSALGTLSITAVGGVTNLQQTVEVSATNTAGTGVAGVSVTLSGAFFTTQTVTTLTGGTVRTIVTIPSATGQHILNVSAQGYAITSITLSAAGVVTTPPVTPPPVTPPPATTVADPSSIQISGPATRTEAVVNSQLDAPLLVRVLDNNGSGVPDARVIFRLRTGQGRLSERGNGRAIGVQTDASGFARANYTPASASSTVEAEVSGVTSTVTFTISTGSAPATGTGTRDADTAPGTISPVVHVGAAQRPPMLWVDGGAIYALVGASPQRFAPSVDNALNLTVAGGKVYWTEKTGESGGTINSANLNGSGVTELASIFATPMGIAVDVTNSKLYWTNSAGRIQSANLDGSRITNELQNLASPMDIALAGGNAYWTQGGNVRFVNLKGQKVVRNVSTGMDTAGSLAIGGGKVYWTEITGESGGTVNSANLNGTGATQLASILAAPMGIAVDGARSKLYWTNARGRIQSANLDGSKIQNVVSGLGSPGELVLSNSISAPASTTTTTTTTTASNAKYDLNSDGAVDNADAALVADAMGTSNTKYDVNGDGTVNFLDLLLVFDNRDPGAAGAPTIVGMKLSAAQIDIIEEQIDLLIATNDRSPSAMRVLVYLQQLLVTARPEKTQLLANYPNPFNPETWIPYELATDTHVRITIYNTQGVVIRTLQLGHQSGGYYTGRDRAAYWDGRNALGEQVASGLYFYQLETDEMSLMRKMVILK